MVGRTHGRRSLFVTPTTVFLSLGFLVCIGALVVFSSPTWALGQTLKKARAPRQRNSIRRASAQGHQGEGDSGAAASSPEEVSSWLTVLKDWGLGLNIGGGDTDDGSQDGEDLWYGEEVTGYGPFNCTAQDVIDQASDWRKMTSNSDGRWMVHCAGHNATLAVHRVSPGRQGKVFIDIGANKGVGAGVRPSSRPDLSAAASPFCRCSTCSRTGCPSGRLSSASTSRRSARTGRR